MLIDFHVFYANGTEEYLEVKAWREGKWIKDKQGRKIRRGKGGLYYHPGDKLKIAIWKANNPDKKLRIITQQDLPKGF